LARKDTYGGKKDRRGRRAEILSGKKIVRHAGARARGGVDPSFPPNIYLPRGSAMPSILHAACMQFAVVVQLHLHRLTCHAATATAHVHHYY